MILLDTNVVSENLRPQPNPAVISWVDSQPTGSLYLCTPVLAELRFGLERLAAGERKGMLLAAIDRIENDYFRGRILVFDINAAAEYGRLAAGRQRLGRRIQQMDGLIAAIASIHRLTIATRDTRDFADLGLDIINPFEPSIAPS
jgi:hypothetical protein